MTDFINSLPRGIITFLSAAYKSYPVDVGKAFSETVALDEIILNGIPTTSNFF